MKRVIINTARLFMTMFVTLSATIIFGQEEVENTTVVEINRPLYEQFGMTSTQLFVLMTAVTLVLVIAVISLSTAISNIAQFKINKMFEKGAKISLLLIGLFASGSAMAANTESTGGMHIPFPDQSFWIFVIFDVFLLLLIFFLKGVLNSMLREYAEPRKFIFWQRFKTQMTDAVPIEDETTILLDHDYDGIRELDNNLPPWWKYGFYATVVWGIGYFVFYMIPGGGPGQEEEFLMAWEEGEREVAEYKASHPELVTKETAVLLNDTPTLSMGSSLFAEKCVTCHADGGAGAAGPNLTDNYWIYGNDVKKVFESISEGRKNGMKAWNGELNGIEIQALTSYILQLDPILPPQGQEPKGDYIPRQE